MIWSDLYRPKRIEQMIGNEEARLAVLKWLTGWRSGTKPLLLIGPPGVGKTTFVMAASNQLNYDLIDLNASDTRNKQEIQALIKPLLNNRGIFGREVILFLDEVDGIAGREDTGGMEAILAFLKEPTIPIILAANSKNAKIKELSKACKVIQFHPVPSSLLLMYLNHVLELEGKDLSQELKNNLVSNCRGDARSLLNSAQSLVAGYKTTTESSSTFDIADAVEGFFSSASFEEARAFIRRGDFIYKDPRFGMSPEERRRDIVNALYSSIIMARLDSESIALLLDSLSKIDILVSKISRSMQYSLIKYMDTVVASLLYHYAREKGIRYNQYSFIWPVLSPIFARARSNRGLLEIFAKLTHTSQSNFGSTTFPYMISIFAYNMINPVKFIESENIDSRFADALTKELTHFTDSKRRSRTV